MRNSIYTASVLEGKVIFAKTGSETYWMLITAPQVADTYRQGFDQDTYQFLGRRKLSAFIEEYAEFTFYDENDMPIAKITPTEIGIRNDIPKQGILF